jgi:hypothetical protein
MLGGEHPFYSKIGYEVKEEIPSYYWEVEVFFSWE